MNIQTDTIVAICTPLAPSAIAVIRISGKDAQKIADKVFVGNKKIKDLDGYSACFGKILDKNSKFVDECIALNFLEPRSFTGENVVEISCHGGTFIAKKVLETILYAGARPATAGEFTKRAFLNGKLDLSEAESVIELISASGNRMHEAAVSVKQGFLSKEIDKILSKMVDIAGDLSAWADYPDDDVPQVDEQKLSNSLSEISQFLNVLISNFDRGKIYREGVNTVIVGRPNAGKSSLMNLLTGCERSIVTDIAGTTRDVVEERIMLGDVPIILADTAGLRETDDPVERIGVDLAQGRIESAELVLAVFDSSKELTEQDIKLIEDCKNRPSIAVINKSDLEQKINNEYIENNFNYHLYISALENESIDKIQHMIEKMLNTGTVVTNSAMLCTERQRNAVNRALSSINEAKMAMDFSLTLDAVTVMIEDAVHCLLELKGEKVSDTLVNNVFERFCVGK